MKLGCVQINTLKLKHPLLTVDAIIFCGNDSVVLIKRKNPPYEGLWALPGGFVEYGETVESAVKREVEEETGLQVDIVDLLGVYSDPKRDPRGHVVSACFIAQKKRGSLRADTDASQVSCMKIDEILNIKLAFDHKKIFKDYLNLKTYRSW